MAVGEALGLAWARLWKNPVLWLAGALVAAALSSATAGLIAGPLVVGLLRALDREASGAAPSGIEVWFQGFDALGPALVVSLLVGIGTFVGSLIFVFPAFLVAPLWIPALWLVARGEVDPLRALSDAWSLLAADRMGHAVAHFVLGVVALAGYVVFGVGELISMPLAFVAAVTMAQPLMGPAGAARRPPPSTPPPSGSGSGGWGGFGGSGPFGHPKPPPSLPGAGPMGPEIR
jgi:hypothetical protein